MLSEKDKKTEAAMARQPEKVTPVVVDEPRKKSGLYERKERFHESERNQVDGRGRTSFDFL